MPEIGPDFRVRYRVLSPEEGGRRSGKPIFQGYRSDWKYEADANISQIYMIWPTFEDPNGLAISKGTMIATAGTAIMTIVDPTMKIVHRNRIALGVRGFLVEGTHRVAEAEVIEILGLASPPGA